MANPKAGNSLLADRNGKPMITTQQAALTAPALTSDALTDSTGGTANLTVEDVTASHSQTILNNNFADVVAQINAINADLINIRNKIIGTQNVLNAHGLTSD